MSVNLTQTEIRALLIAAGEGGEGGACFEDETGEPDPKLVKALDSGMQKLAEALKERS